MKTQLKAATFAVILGLGASLAWAKIPPPPEGQDEFVLQPAEVELP